MAVAAAASMKGGGDPHAAVCPRDGLMDQVAEASRSERMGPSVCELVRRARELRAEGGTNVDEVSPPRH